MSYLFRKDIRRTKKEETLLNNSRKLSLDFQHNNERSREKFTFEIVLARSAFHKPGKDANVFTKSKIFGKYSIMSIICIEKMWI